MRKSFYPLIALTVFSLGCSVKTVQREPNAADPNLSTPPTPAPAKVETIPQPVPMVEPLPATAAAEEEPTPAPTPQAHHPEAKGVPAEKALGWLKNGNTRFQKMSLRKDGQSPKDVKRLSSGQTPHSIVLSCSDSRVPPELVFDQKLGEIFVVRNAGEIPDTASIASIEYAVEHLGAQLLVVMGHTSCGAVKAALSTMDGSDAGSPSLNALVQDIHPRLSEFKGRAPASASANVETESWANADGVVRDLLKRSPLIRAKVASGELKIQSALYHLDNGKVDFDHE
ncbi:MAG: carbonic anhydrase [Pseudobdellovibrionaceae bacterium]